MNTKIILNLFHLSSFIILMIIGLINIFNLLPATIRQIFAESFLLHLTAINTKLTSLISGILHDYCASLMLELSEPKTENATQ